nr:zinc knuckle CX2CX4HX4C [Tanacetum cinerariifolium]
MTSGIRAKSNQDRPKKNRSYRSPKVLEGVGYAKVAGEVVQGGGGKKMNNKQGNDSLGSIMDNASFPPLYEHMPSSYGGKFRVEHATTTSIKIIRNAGCVSTWFTDSIPMLNTTTPICEPSKVADEINKENENERVGNTPVNVVPLSYPTTLRPTSSNIAHLQKLEVNVPNDADYDICDNLVMAVLNLKGTGYTKEIIRVEYEWKPPRCSTCLIFGHSLNDCLKAPKRVVNKMNKGNGTFSLYNLFEALNVKISVSEEVETGNKASTSVSAKTGNDVDLIPSIFLSNIFMVRIDYAPWGQNAPHTHPRATEILVTACTLNGSVVGLDGEGNELDVKNPFRT